MVTTPIAADPATMRSVNKPANTTASSRKYDLIYEEGVLKSQQYPTSIGRIDILATDKKTKNYVVIELKKNQTSDDTIGQLSRYMGWIKEHKKDDGVKGIIVAGKFDEKLKYAKNKSEIFSIDNHSKIISKYLN